MYKSISYSNYKGYYAYFTLKQIVTHIHTHTHTHTHTYTFHIVTIILYFIIMTIRMKPSYEFYYILI